MPQPSPHCALQHPRHAIQFPMHIMRGKRPSWRCLCIAGPTDADVLPVWRGGAQRPARRLPAPAARPSAGRAQQRTLPGRAARGVYEGLRAAQRRLSRRRWLQVRTSAVAPAAQLCAVLTNRKSEQSSCFSEQSLLDPRNAPAISWRDKAGMSLLIWQDAPREDDSPMFMDFFHCR